jgi:hypothetical protein
MSTTAAMEIGSDLWNARVYAGLSVASELAAKVDKPRSADLSFTKAIVIYWSIGRFNRTLEEVLAAFDNVIERRTKSSTQTQTSESAYRSARNVLLNMYPLPSIFVSLSDLFSRHWLLHGRLVRMKMNIERLLDVVDWLDVMSAPDVMNAKFDVALTELEKGDVVSWAAVQ